MPCVCWGLPHFAGEKAEVVATLGLAHTVVVGMAAGMGRNRLGQVIVETGNQGMRPLWFVGRRKRSALNENACIAGDACAPHQFELRSYAR